MRGSDINFNVLNEMVRLARGAGVSFAINYEEPADTWYGEITSAAVGEGWTGRSRTFETAAADLLEHLDSL